MGIVASFPASWRCTVTVHRGGVDRQGNPLPTQDIDLPGCLVGQRSTRDPLDRSDLLVNAVSIYVDDPLTVIKSGDTFTVPPGAWPSGEFRLDGEPYPTPLGLEIPVGRG